jgi:hypothetical protein
MKKLVLAILMIAVAMPAFASETRVRALGPMTAPYIEDDSNVFMWPATLAGYANLVTITAGYYDVVKWGDDRGYYDDSMTAKFGMTYGLGEDNKYGVLGMWWQEHTWGPNYMGSWYGPWDGWQSTDFGENVYNKWNIMWATAFETIDIGIRFERADEGDYEETDGESGERSINYTTLGLGLRWDLNDEAMMDLAFDYTTVGFTYQDLGSTDKVEADAKSIMALRARMFYEWTDVITWVPYFNYKWGNLSLKSSETGYYDDDECWGMKGFQFDIGLAANIDVNDDNLLIVGIEPYGMYKGEPSECGGDAGSEEMKLTIFPAFVFGLESDVKDWLTFRAGCSKALLKTTYKGDYEGSSYEDYYTWAPFEWQLGLGFHVGDFDIDMLINKEAPFSMGYWLTGIQPGQYETDDIGAPIGMISATYSF